MKNKLWLFQLPFILILTFCFHVMELGVDGKLENRTLRDTVFPNLRRISGLSTDIKFWIRGKQAPKNKIAIVDIDDAALEQIGRWPWHRDAMGFLINQTFKAGAKAVALDIVFSEPDTRISEELQKVLESNQLGNLKQQFETDYVLQQEIKDHADQLVLGWAPAGHCQPLYDPSELCPVSDPDLIKALPDNYSKFAYDKQTPEKVDMSHTPLISVPKVLANIPEYNGEAKHAGYFLSTPDDDGIIRRVPMAVMVNGKAYPGLPLALARTALKESLSIKMTPELRVGEIRMEHSGVIVPVSPVGAVEVNFRGPARTFPYVAAMDVLRYGATESNEGRQLASAPPVAEVLKDALVFIGISATGANDIRAFPFDSHVPGVEGHASILDNILSRDFLTRGQGWNDHRWMYLIMIVGGVFFALFTQKLEAIPALLLTLAAFGGIGLLDVKILFEKNNVNWNTSFLFIELSSIFIFTLAAKYVMEEQNKKFVRGAFAKYVAPAVVDSILKDPKKLTVGGERRELTILFSDIRGFTSFSEKMDAKALASFLNDYLGIMTKIVFSNEGTLDKYIGDAIMAFWGAPLDQPRHATNACHTAIQMMKALKENKKRFRDQYDVEVDIGIGLNTGMVSVGNMGSSDNFAYTVIGDHVNLASRLEGLTKYYGASIVTTRFTFDSIAQSTGEAIPHRVLDFVKVKGKKVAVEMIQVLDQEMSQDALNLFSEARKAYSERKWDEAIELFKRTNRLLVGEARSQAGEMDGPCRMYIDRCEELKTSVLAADWDGSWEMHSK